MAIDLLHIGPLLKLLHPQRSEASLSEFISNTSSKGGPWAGLFSLCKALNRVQQGLILRFKGYARDLMQTGSTLFSQISKEF